MYKIYRKNNYLIIDNSIDISEKYLAKDILVQEIVENVSYEIFGILPKLGNSSNQLLHSISIPNIIKEDDSPYTINEWVDFYTVNTGFFFELTNGDGNSGSIPLDQFVDSYSDLPDPTTTQYQIWVCKNSEGTQWLPGSLGGTYYPEGGYASDGVKWIYHKDNYQASQPEVDDGIVNDKWVSPLTLENANKWSTKYDNSNPSGFETPSQLNSRDTNNRNRNNHTGTQLASTISDIQSTITNNTDVLANTAKETNATHTGEVTGSSALVVNKSAITNKTNVTASLADLILISDTSDSENLKKVTVQSIIDLAPGGGGGGNSTTQTVDFGSTFTDKAQIVVTGQSWVTTTSEIVAHVKTPVAVDPDEMRLLEFTTVISDLVNGVGFTLTVYSEPEATGTYEIMCIGI